MAGECWVFTGRKTAIDRASRYSGEQHSLVWSTEGYDEWGGPQRLWWVGRAMISGVEHRGLWWVGLWWVGWSTGAMMSGVEHRGLWWVGWSTGGYDEWGGAQRAMMSGVEHRGLWWVGWSSYQGHKWDKAVMSFMPRWCQKAPWYLSAILNPTGKKWTPCTSLIILSCKARLYRHFTTLGGQYCA